MVLCSKLVDHAGVNYVINTIRKKSKTFAIDVVCAYNLFCEINSELNEAAKARLDRAFVLCKYMDPDIEDVISILLYREQLLGNISDRVFMHKFSETRYDKYYQQIADACRNAPQKEGLSEDECVGYYIMMRVCDKMFKRLMKTMNHNRVTNAVLVTKAYNMAKEAHYWAKRASGEPYIVHPLRVAGILANYGVESPVISAALLHDVVEDTSYTLDDISKEFGMRISQYVDAVTSVHKEFAASLRPADYPCDRMEMDMRSFEKLTRTVAGNREMMAALYIKAADRIHNLSTIDSMPSINIHNKNDETQLDYLPLFKAFNLYYFVHEIENLMWRATDIGRYTGMQEKYDDMLNRNREQVDEFVKLLTSEAFLKAINNYAQSFSASGYDVEVQRRALLPYDVYNCIKQAEEPLADPSQQIEKRIVPICDIDIIPDPRDTDATLDNFVSCFVKAFDAKIAERGRTITRFSRDDQNHLVLEIEDRYRNRFRCRLIMRDDYDAQKIGMGVSVESDEQEYEINEKVEKINVRLRNGKVISMPKGSTVIDVAFAIHEEIGFTVRSATINGQKVTIYNMLSDGDKIVIEADTCREDGITKTFVPHVRITWLNWVVTKKAKKKIIEYLSDMYEGDDPRTESNAPTSVVEAIADKLLQELKPAT